MSQYTALALRDTPDLNTPSFYDLTESDSAHIQFDNEEDRNPIDMNLEFGSVHLSG